MVTHFSLLVLNTRKLSAAYVSVLDSCGVLAKAVKRIHISNMLVKGFGACCT